MEDWLKSIFNNAITPREKLDIIVSILKNKLNYQHDDFYFNEEYEFLMIKNVIMIMWSRTRDTYIFSFSVNTEVLGSCILIDCLHKNGITNIEFKQNFYISPVKKTINHEHIIYYGEEANELYYSEMYNYYKQKILNDEISNNILVTINSEGKTFH